ncbi:hypoxanthine phosphoribosyltransferase [Persicirhabdus sediminis]|uniref:Hypoxanthine phosphoribosyltransferase n=1 Tax=Persicirhabdus sediminis TaxID=454144 RepID=A0A8J7SKN0_9BACT|nr:hypoxanthine phosphoribosyltransferase [Persicirhabdus sediminis]MBK1791831.1 hypoxanthine phosphoribosyltransferase [Persicirhabdus sediminis]
MHKDIDRVLIDEDIILKRLDHIAEKIRADFEGKPLVAIVLLKGAMVFTADLLRRLPIHLEIECLNVASYKGTSSTGIVSFLDKKLPDVANKNVLIIDDILDTGRTLEAVAEKLSDNGASMIKTCVLLTKDIPREDFKEANYSGFDIANEFVVGYGLDYNGRYRNLPFIGVLKQSVYQD